MAADSRLRHRLREFAFCLSAGVLISAVLAVACAVGVDPALVWMTPLDQTDQAQVEAGDLARMRGHSMASQYSDDQLVVGDECRTGVDRRVAKVLPYWNATLNALSAPRREHMQGAIYVRIRAGWPWRAFQGEQWLDERTSFSLASRRVDLGEGYERFGLLQVPLDDRTRTGLANVYVPRLIPFLPHWPGFALNTLLYAACAWLLLFAPFAFCRALRRRRGLCERCAYPRGESDRCSECGASLAKTSRPSTA